jgi:RNA polymerase sigma factor (TIGR02999 family)
MPLVYTELEQLARRRMRAEGPGHSLQPTDLVNEVYLRLVQQQHAEWRHRAQFLAVAATLMRRILVDRARRRLYQKRGGAAVRVSLDDVTAASPERPDEVIQLDEALQRLQQQDLRKARVVELRYFGGLTIEEISGFLGVSQITVKRDWAMARAWLRREISHAAAERRETP